MTCDNSKRKERQTPLKTNSACHHCWEQGHWIAKCPVRLLEHVERQRPQRANIAQVEDDSDDFLFSVVRDARTTKSSCVWLVDVGKVTFGRDGCFAEAKGLRWKLGVREGKGLFKLCMTPIMPDEANVTSSTGCHGDTTSYLWHLRLGHIGHSGLDAIVKKNCGSDDVCKTVGAMRWVCTGQATTSKLHAQLA